MRPPFFVSTSGQLFYALAALWNWIGVEFYVWAVRYALSVWDRWPR